MKPKVYASIDMNEARSPLVRIVHASEWDYLMDELRYLREERVAVVAWLRSQAETTNYRPRGCPLADAIERGEHRREDAP